MKLGLVLEGGAMRGMYTAGVLDVLLDGQIEVQGVIGVSAGAVFGVNFLSRQRGRVIRYNKRCNGDKEYMGVRQLLKTGNLVSTDFAYGTVPRELDPFDDETFQACGVPFYAGVTSLDSGKIEYMQVKSVLEQMDVLRASASMPFLSRPVELHGKRYLDGGVADSIPFQKMLELGHDRLIVVLTRDRSYVKAPMPAAAVKLWYGRYRGFSQALLHRHEEYARSVRQLEVLEQLGAAFVFRPSEPITIGRMEKDPEKLQAVYELGIADGRRGRAALKEFLER